MYVQDKETCQVSVTVLLIEFVISKHCVPLQLIIGQIHILHQLSNAKCNTCRLFPAYHDAKQLVIPSQNCKETTINLDRLSMSCEYGNTSGRKKEIVLCGWSDYGCSRHHRWKYCYRITYCVIKITVYQHHRIKKPLVWLSIHCLTKKCISVQIPAGYLFVDICTLM